MPQRIAALQADVAALEKQLAERTAAGPLSGERLLESAEQVGGVTVVVTEVPGVEANLMRQLIDQVRGEGVVVGRAAGSRQGDDKVTLVAGISKDLQARKLSAGEWIRPVAAAVGGGGGGRPDMAQAGGKEPGQVARSSPDCQGHDPRDARAVDATVTISVQSSHLSRCVRPIESVRMAAAIDRNASTCKNSQRRIAARSRQRPKMKRIRRATSIALGVHGCLVAVTIL